jgi:SOS-response transcriptional repressor LexA
MASDLDLLGIGERVRELRGPTSGSAFAAELGVSQSFLSYVERGERAPSVRMLFALAGSGVNAGWVLSGEGDKLSREKLMVYAPELRVVEAPRYTKRRVAPSDYVPLPLLKDRIAAGMPTEIDESDVEPHPALAYAEWCPDPEQMVCIRVRGDSMEPTLADGDIVAVNHAVRDPKKLLGKVVALRDGGGATVKRLRFSKKLGLYLGRPDNPENDDLVQFPPDGAREAIIGKVEWWWKRQA